MKPSAPVRVLHVVNSLGLGGTEKTMQLLVRHLDRSIFSPLVHSAQDGPRRAQLKACGVPVAVGGDLFALTERFRPHVVHVHRAGWAEPAVLTPILRHKPRVLVETNVFGRHDDSPGGAAFHLRLFVSRFCLERYARDFGPRADLSRCRVLPNPVDTDLFERLCPAPDLSRPVAGRLTRPDPGKWSHLVFAMLPELARLEPGFRLRVVGATAEFLEFLRDKPFAANVEILPQLERDEDLAAFFNQIAVLAHANDTGESFGMAIAEAMAAGLPVVTHPAQGERDNNQLELVEHGVTGLVAETGPEYARALVRLWRDPDAAAVMGRAGRERIRDLCRAQDLSQRLGRMYLELLEGAA